MHLLVEDRRDKEMRSAVPEGGREREYRYACVVLARRPHERERKGRERERAGQHRQDKVEAAHTGNRP